MSETAGSDLPARGQNVTVDNANGKTPVARGVAPVTPPRPEDYKAKHAPGRHKK